YGLSGAWYTISNSIGVLVLALFFARLYRSLDTVTVPGIIGNFIGKDARTVASVMLIFVMIAVGASQIIAAGTLGVSILNMNYNLSVVILGLCFIAYTIAGGMNAVGTTNIMHLIVMYGGIIIALVVLGMKVGGLDILTTKLDPDTYFNLASIGRPKVSSWIIASVLGACTAQAGIQPILAAKDVRVARKSAFITALIVAPFGILTATLGMYAKIMFPDLGNAKLALPALMMSMHPIVGGIVLASVFAAILSTISPIILAAGTMFTKDLYQRFAKHEVEDRKLLFVSRLSTGIAGIVCMIIAITMYSTTKILDIVYFAYTIRGALFIVLLFGIYYKKTSEKGAIIAMIITGFVGFFWVVWKSITGYFPIAPWLTETYAAVIAAAISTLLFSITYPAKEELDQQLKPQVVRGFGK
ncbi:MAG: sodium:solute symporter family protein, partial [Eubacteriales bacterium]|nr:sodium:solute symporter family protein [Eubacteriales bacterium]